MLAHLVDGAEPRCGFVLLVLARQEEGSQGRGVGEALHDGVEEAGVAQGVEAQVRIESNIEAKL